MNFNLSAAHPVWILAMVGGFIAWWPIGLLVLAYILWSTSMARENGQWLDRVKGALGLNSGNAAFAAHKKSVLNDLEKQRQKLAEDERAFAAYMDKLRMARDEAAFNDFLKERGTK